MRLGQGACCALVGWILLADVVFTASVSADLQWNLVSHRRGGRGICPDPLACSGTAVFVIRAGVRVTHFFVDGAGQGRIIASVVIKED